MLQICAGYQVKLQGTVSGTGEVRYFWQRAINKNNPQMIGTVGNITLNGTETLSLTPDLMVGDEYYYRLVVQDGMETCDALRSAWLQVVAASPIDSVVVEWDHPYAWDPDGVARVCAFDETLPLMGTVYGGSDSVQLAWGRQEGQDFVTYNLPNSTMIAVTPAGATTYQLRATDMTLDCPEVISDPVRVELADLSAVACLEKDSAPAICDAASPIAQSGTTFSSWRLSAVPQNGKPKFNQGQASYSSTIKWFRVGSAMPVAMDSVYFIGNLDSGLHVFKYEVMDDCTTVTSKTVRITIE